MDNTTKLLINHAFAHIMLIPAILYGQAWMWILGFFWWQVIAIVAISGGYHRYYSHFSFKAPAWYPYAVNFLGIFAGAGPALTWAATHLQHHASSDTDSDPHSYTKKGWFSVYFNTWGYGLRIKKRFLVRLMRDPILKWFYENYFKVNVALVLILAAIDPMLMIFGYALPVVLGFHGYGILNILGHYGGKPNNTWIGNILTAGEGWHANHHKRAMDYRIGQKWWQFDPTAIFIKLIRKNKS